MSRSQHVLSILYRYRCCFSRGGLFIGRRRHKRHHRHHRRRLQSSHCRQYRRKHRGNQRLSPPQSSEGAQSSVFRPARLSLPAPHVGNLSLEFFSAITKAGSEPSPSRPSPPPPLERRQDSCVRCMWFVASDTTRPLPFFYGAFAIGCNRRGPGTATVTAITAPVSTVADAPILPAVTS